MINDFFALDRRCLIDHGADVAAVNNEGELPLDLAEEDDMEDLLTDEIERLGKWSVLLKWAAKPFWNVRSNVPTSCSPVYFTTIRNRV